MSATGFEKPTLKQRPPSAGSQWNRVTPRATAAKWLVPALKALAGLAQLPDNWDGYGSPPIRSDALEAAHRLVAILEQLPLPVPAIRPVTGGGLNFSWQVDLRELEIEILPGGSVQYLVVATDPATGQEETHDDPLPLDQPGYGHQIAAWLIGR